MNPGIIGRNKDYIEFSLNFIKSNLESNHKFHGNNHLLSNLAVLAIHEKWFSNSYIWQKFFDEINYQFNDDGSNFEGSTSYHFFSTELILISWIFLQKPSKLEDLLKKALGVCNLLLREDFTIPYIGDNDSGRISKLWVELNGEQECLNSYKLFLNSANKLCSFTKPEPIDYKKNTNLRMI